MKLHQVAIYILLIVATWILVEIIYRTAVGVGPFGELTGYDIMLLPLHFAGIATSLGIGRVIERAIWKR